MAGVQEVTDYYRFCPDQVDVHISDSICFGRRRTNYPQCHGCRFNDDEKAGKKKEPQTQLPADADRSLVMEQVFKAYDVRATYPDPLDKSVAWRIGHAAAIFFRNAVGAADRIDPKRMSVVVGRDMRKSSPQLAKALVDGIRSTGTPVIDIGMIDTSQIYFAVNHFEAMGGIQTTASHNPAQYNGFKLCGRGGIPVGQDTGLAEVCRISKKVNERFAGEPAELTEADLTENYKTFVRNFLEPIQPTKVVIDASNGMAGKWAPIIFGDVPNLDIVFLNLETTGEFVHDPNPLVDANLDQLREKVRQTKADFGVCFDGDADRCMLVDENADIVRCDLLTALIARWFLKRKPGTTIVYDLRSSRILPEIIKKHGGIPRRQRVGHTFMKKALAESQGAFGGELSGHFYFQDNYYCDSGMLALAHVLNVLTEAGQSLGELVAPLKQYANSGERNFENPDKDATLAKLADIYKDAEIDYLDGITVQYEKWWFNVRKSNTEPLLRLNLEAESPDLMQTKLDEIAKHLGQPVAH